MPEHVLPETPVDFLARHGESPSVLATFVHPLAVVVVEVTRTDFIRGAGPSNNPSGKWWIRMDTLAQVMAKVRARPEWPNERRNLLQREIRDQTAVSVNWNSLSAFWWMRVEAEPHVGLRGPTKWQSVWDPSTGGPMPASLGNATQRTLPGGGVQYFFPMVAVPVHYYGAARGRTF
jgi:hypothetical protein